jgi:hypothetical protein
MRAYGGKSPCPSGYLIWSKEGVGGGKLSSSKLPPRLLMSDILAHHAQQYNSRSWQYTEYSPVQYAVV